MFCWCQGSIKTIKRQQFSRIAFLKAKTPQFFKPSQYVLETVAYEQHVANSYVLFTLLVSLMKETAETS